jgi:hypothetical protein
MDKMGRATRWLLLCWLLLAQGLAVAHEATHTVLEDSEVCAICSVGGNADAVFQPNEPADLSWPRAQAPLASHTIEPSVQVACGHPVRAPPAIL